MPHRLIENEHDLGMLIHVLREMRLPFTIRWTKGKKKARSLDQNARMWALAKKVGEVLGHTIDEVQNRWKLAYGVPILRARDAQTNVLFHKVLDPLSYEDQLEAMQLMAVTRLMNTSEMNDFFMAVDREAADLGVWL